MKTGQRWSENEDLRLVCPPARRFENWAQTRKGGLVMTVSRRLAPADSATGRATRHSLYIDELDQRSLGRRKKTKRCLDRFVAEQLQCLILRSWSVAREPEKSID